METNGEGTYFQEGDHVHIKRTQEIGRVHAADGGVVYVIMDETNETKLFSARADEDAYIELATEALGTISQEPESESSSEEEGRVMRKSRLFS